MKTKLTLLTLFMFIGTFAFSQSALDSWTELKDFHAVMAATFHQSEKGNLEPIKTRSKELKNQADILAKSKIPKEYDNEKVRKNLTDLQTETAKMDKMITDKASDKDITAYLTVIHDTFHTIIGLCSKDDTSPAEKSKSNQVK